MVGGREGGRAYYFTQMVREEERGGREGGRKEAREGEGGRG